jgi:hypothetical protein
MNIVALQLFELSNFDVRKAIFTTVRRINLFSNVKYGNFGVWKFPMEIFSELSVFESFF